MRPTVRLKPDPTDTSATLRWHSAFALSLLLAIGCSQPAPTPGVITIAIPVSPNNLDPRFGTDENSARAHQLLFNDLLRWDEQTRLAPGLAASWETTDHQTYRIRLREGVRFHDGHELTSADVVFTFSSMVDPAFASPWRGAFRDLASIIAVDRYTVDFVLKQPSGSFLPNLVFKIVPAGAGRELRLRPIGTGPYEFVSYAVDDRLEVRAFRDYFDGLPRNLGLVMKIVPDDIMRGLELRKATSDLIVNDLAPDMVYQLEKEGLSLTTSPGVDYQYLGFNLRDPVLKDVRVRHAIGHAINRQAIVDYLRRGLATVADSILPPTNWAYEPDVMVLDYDPERSKALLDEAGYPDPDGDGPRPRLSLSYKTTSVEFSRLQAAVIQQNLRDVGIEIDVRSYEFATLYADVLKGTFQMYAMQWVGDALADPDILRRVFHSQQLPPAGFNRGHFSDPEVDRVIDEASKATDYETRRQLYGKVQQLIAEAAPYISLWHRTNFALSQPAIDGIRLTPQADFTFLRNVSR
ncbi:MAG TPA: ABC transporter substrate-binding protein [Vicinamibacterales bacterium]|nr:ABC transporter substrate-binding protein [Vicinamibacterales bacterium]